MTQKTPSKASDRTNRASGNYLVNNLQEDREIRIIEMSLTVARVQTDFAQPNIWTLIEDNAHVGAALKALLLVPMDEKKNYAPVTALLNAASYAFVTATQPDASDTELVIFFDTPHHHISRGDYLARNAKADWIAHLVPLYVLRAVVERTRDDAAATAAESAIPQGWPRFIGIGEGKTSVSEDSGQFLKYLGALKMYRPDLTTVHGFQFSHGQLRISSLNPCGVFQSQYFGRETKSAWVAYIVLLYKAHTDRDTRITLRAPKDEHVRCDVALPRGTFCFTPFHASTHPGRMTWVAFQIGEPSDELSAVCKRDCVGAVKVSWQDQSSAFTEKQLFDKAHEKTWLPGLARHWSCERDTGLGASIHVGASVTRVKETLHLASVGDPLSQCRSALHALKVVYDLTEVHLQLLRRGVLHRDVSWYNVLCNPWHDPATVKLKPVASGVPCIEWILTDTAGNPCVLLTDLDHSALYPELYNVDHSPRRERTGTPMFMALELSASKREVLYNRDDPSHLCEKLAAAENLGDVYARAFPKGGGNFMTNFAKVCELEEQRRIQRKATTTNKDELHRPAHDIESIFWTLLWIFVRACPEGSEPFQPSENVFSKFANDMLDHTVGIEDNTRPGWLIRGEPFANILHARLGRFVPLFDDLAAYLSIPWTLYQDIVEDDHAHVAIRRLLLVAIHTLHREPDVDVVFNRSQPRIIKIKTTPVTDVSTQPSTRDRISAAAGNVSTGSKRKSRDEDEDEDGDEEAVEPEQKRVKADDAHVCRLRGCNVNSAGARSEKAWDNFLWFGVGRRKPQRQRK